MVAALFGLSRKRRSNLKEWNVNQAETHNGIQPPLFKSKRVECKSENGTVYEKEYGVQI